MGDRGDAGLRHQLRDREAQRDVDRDRENVLRNDEIEVELLDELGERILATVFDLLDLIRRIAASLEAPEQFLLKFEDVRLSEERLLKEEAVFRRRV